MILECMMFCNRCIGQLGQSQAHVGSPLKSWLHCVFQRHGMQWRVFTLPAWHVPLESATSQRRSCRTCSNMQKFHLQLIRWNATLSGSSLHFTICANQPAFISQYTFHNHIHHPLWYFSKMYSNSFQNLWFVNVKSLGRSPTWEKKEIGRSLLSRLLKNLPFKTFSNHKLYI